VSVPNSLFKAFSFNYKASISPSSEIPDFLARTSLWINLDCSVFNAKIAFLLATSFTARAWRPLTSDTLAAVSSVREAPSVFNYLAVEVYSEISLSCFL